MCRSFGLEKHTPFLPLRVPGYIRREFREETVQKNDFSLRVVCGIIFVVESFNLFRVLFLTSAGLGTRNNRIYFSLYCTLVAVAVLWLALRQLLRQAPAGLRQAAQYGVTALLFWWHLGLNTYDLLRDPGAGVTVLTTALLARALFIQMPPWYSLVQAGADYLAFRLTMAPLLEAGDRLNLTITFAVALAVSLAHFRHTAHSLTQQKQIVEMNARLQELVQSDPLTGLLNKAAAGAQAEELLRRWENRGLTLFLLDLDDFKSVNDRFGHPCGDRVLVETANSIRRVFSEAVGLGRMGGDEFTVLFDRPLTEARAQALSRTLGEQLERIQWQGRPMKIRCSVGVGVCERPLSYQQFYAQTDRTLYQAKAAGSGLCRVCRLGGEEEYLAGPERA